jgi:hypothetical protein
MALRATLRYCAYGTPCHAIAMACNKKIMIHTLIMQRRKPQLKVSTHA